MKIEQSKSNPRSWTVFDSEGRVFAGYTDSGGPSYWRRDDGARRRYVATLERARRLATQDVT